VASGKSASQPAWSLSGESTATTMTIPQEENKLLMSKISNKKPKLPMAIKARMLTKP
jgi:hypothetical protein